MVEVVIEVDEEVVTSEEAEVVAVVEIQIYLSKIKTEIKEILLDLKEQKRNFDYYVL